MSRQPDNTPAIENLDSGRPIVLVGLMGAGKSVVGERLARRLGRPFADTDLLIEAEAGSTIAEIWRAEGEAAFRARERRWIEELPVRLRGHVVALGGGMFIGEDNVNRLRSSTWSVWLRARVETLAARLAPAAAPRPLLASTDPERPPDIAGRLAEFLALRASWYGRAHLVIDTDGLDPEAVALEIERALARPGLA